jgi:hypothetical protein
MDPDAEEYSGKIPENLEYFGNCKSTVDNLSIWDATEMASSIENSMWIPYSKVVSLLHQAKPSAPKNVFGKESNFICGINADQEIMFIYNINLDMHYFFSF